MVNGICPTLNSLARTLQDAYTVRDDALLHGKSKDGAAFLRAESDLKRIHQLIATHRVTCQQCIRNDEQRETRMISRRAEIIPINRVT